MGQSVIQQGMSLVMQFVITIVVSILVATGIMILVYCLPVEPMKENVWRSRSIYSFEGGYPQWAGENYKMTQLDNITDGYMLLEAIYSGAEGPVNNAMLNRYMTYADVNPEQAALMQAHGVDTEPYVATYGRYWHGYLLFLKPLLLLFDVADIRIINMILCLGLSFYLIAETRHVLGNRVAIAMFVMWIVINPVSIVMSFQFSTTFYVMIVASLLVLHRDAWLVQGSRYAMLFLFIGIVTNFIDFLTYPMVGMVVPLILAILLRERRKDKCILGFTVLNGFAWGIGYACMWIGKWSVATWITGQDIIANAISEAGFQSTGQEEFFGTRITAINSILMNIRVIVKWPILILVLIIGAWSVWRMVRDHRRLDLRCTIVDTLLVLIAMLPIMWYCIFQGHSIMCYWFTYRNLSITVLAGLLFCGRRIGCGH